MIRIYLPYIFGLAHDLEPLAALPDNQAKKLGEVFLTLLNADNAITQLMSSTSLFAPYLRSSYPLSQQLLAVIRAQTHPTPRDFERELSQYDPWGIRNIYAQYRTALLAELGSFNAYFVSAKGGFDMYSLLQAGEAIFPSELATKVPEALTDAREAAKALAYDVPTSCGFHTFRVTETVLRKYYVHVTGSKALLRVRNIGVYLNALKQANKGDEKIRAALKQMTDLHRNPLARRWRRVLTRRSERTKINWKQMKQLIDTWLPPPRILHPWPDKRFAVSHPR